MEPPAPRAPLLTVLAVAVVAALVAGVAVVAFDDEREAVRTDDAAESPATTVSPGSPPTASELDRVVDEISAFVADERELEFKRDVTVELLDNEAFAARLREDAIEDLDALAETEGVLRALGLLARDVDLAETLLSFLGDSVVGFYDPETDALVLRGTALTPYVRTTLAHELTHALDDQHFELDRPALDESDDESSVGFSALVEGNALRVEDAYRETMSEEERQQAQEEERALSESVDLSNVPPVLPHIIAFPYIAGPPLVGALVDEGGEQRVDEAYANPPRTSEQVLDPAGWLAGRAEPVTVEPPVADGEVFDEGVLGLYGIVLVLGAELGNERASQAAQGWGGDWYVAWREGDRTCVRGTVVMDTERDLAELASAAEDWSVTQDDAEVERESDRVTVTSCG